MTDKPLSANTTIDGHSYQEAAEELRKAKEKIRCTYCRREVIVNKDGECPRCGLLLLESDTIPF